MKIIIMGGGVIGVSTAWYLAQAGHEVTVLERQAAVAMETSHANAGMLSYGYTTPWAAPGIPFKAMKWLLKNHSPLVVRPDGTLNQLCWMKKMLANCSDKRYAVNKARMERLSAYSQTLFAEIEAQTGINYEARKQGTLQVFRSQKEVDGVAKDMAVLAEYDVPFQLLKPQEILQYEPGLKDQLHRLVAALHLPDDDTGDCYLFTTQLAKLCEDKGVKFLFNQTIEGLEYQGDKLTAVRANGKRLTADHYVCALGSYSRPILKTVGLEVPIYPIKGYSITLPVIDEEKAPQSTILDETYKVAVTRFDQRIRVGGMAELTGYGLGLPKKRQQTLLKVVNELFPAAGDESDLNFWTGLRATTPDSVPIIGATAFDNLSINSGHGTLGWTMSQGSAKLLADLISGATPAIEYQDLTLNRYA